MRKWRLLGSVRGVLSNEHPYRELFMALLNGDRFEGRFRARVPAIDVSDLMRRMVKKRPLRFDGTPLFPERIAYTVS